MGINFDNYSRSLFLNKIAIVKSYKKSKLNTRKILKKLEEKENKKSKKIS